MISEEKNNADELIEQRLREEYLQTLAQVAVSINAVGYIRGTAIPDRPVAVVEAASQVDLLGDFIYHDRVISAGIVHR